MKFNGKRLLFIDIETSGLPLTRKRTRRTEKYPSPNINIVYDKSRLLTASVEFVNHFSGRKSDDHFPPGRKSDNDFVNTKSWVRKPLDDACYTTNKGKYKGDYDIKTILDELTPYFACDYVIGHNVLFDLNIIANEAYRINHPLYEYIVDIMKSCKYFCTLIMAKMLGIEDRDISLSSVVTKLNVGDIYASTSYSYHDSCEDVKATKFIFDVGTTKINAIPAEIDEITDIIYPPTTYVFSGTENTSGTENMLVMKVKEYAFNYYKKVFNASRAVYYASGKAEFHVTEVSELPYTNDGLYHLNGTTYDCNFDADGYETECESCGLPAISLVGEVVGSCSKCINDNEFIAAQQFISMEANFDEIIVASEFKKTIPKSGKRMATLVIETRKKGRSLVLPKNKVDFYMANHIYKYFSLTVGSSKI